MTSLSIDTRQLRAMAKELRASAPKVNRRIRAGVLAEAKVVADSARGKASWSTRIPGTVRASSSVLNTAVVRAGGASAPHARPYEHAGAPGVFRHPVWGHGDRASWHWVEQAARPFLHPAAIERLPETRRVLGLAVTDAVHEAL